MALASLPGAVSAATQTAALSFAKNNTGLGGGASFGFNQSTTFDAGIAVVDFGASANSGDVDASANVNLSATYDDTIDLADAGNTVIDLQLTGSSFSFATFVGATAGAGVNFGSFIGINPPRLAVIDKGYDLTTSGTGNGLGNTVSDTGNTDIIGAGVNTPGLIVQSEVTLDASKESSFRLDELEGIVRATHMSGVTRTGAFDIVSTMDSVNLDLSLAGSWNLDLVGVALRNTFDTALGLAASLRLGVGAGSGCGDLSKDSDNGFFCLFDEGVTETTPQLDLADPAAFEIDFGTKSASIGGLTVVAPPPPPAIPVPASLPLLAAGIGGLALWRRRAT